MTTLPAHVFRTGAKVGLESIRGDPSGSMDYFNNTIQSFDADTEKEFHEARGPGSDILQSQELLAYRHTLRLDFDVYSGAFLRDYCMRYDWEVPSVSWQFSFGGGASRMGKDIYGAVCNSLRLSSAQRAILSASTDWLGLWAQDTVGFDWDAPVYRPYVWARGSWSLGGYIVGIDLTVENNIQELQAMTDVEGDYNPTHLLPGYMAVRADIRAVSDYDVTPITDDIEAVLEFTSGANVLTITLERGTYRGKRHTITQDALIEFGIPLVFANCSIEEA